MPSAVTTIATLGDSLTAPYLPGEPRAAAGDRSWVQLLQAAGDKHLALDNLAVSGATSSDVLANQVPAAEQLVASGAVKYVSLIVGANDVADPTLFGEILAGIPQPFVAEVTGNIEAAVTGIENAAAASGHRVGVALGTIPDVGLTPAVQFELLQAGFPPAALPGLLANITAATVEANNELESFAAAHEIPVVDLYGLGHLVAQAPTSPVEVGGVPVSNLYSPDFFHPNTVGQGLLGNTVLGGVAEAYHPGLQRFRLTDQQILDDADVAHGPGHSFYDVRSYVLFQDDDRDHRHGDDDSAWHSHDGDGWGSAAWAGHHRPGSPADELFAGGLAGLYDGMQSPRAGPELPREPDSWYACLCGGRRTRSASLAFHSPPSRRSRDEPRPAPPHRRGDEPSDPAPGLSLTSPPSNPSATQLTAQMGAAELLGQPREGPADHRASSSRSTASSSRSRNSPPPPATSSAMAELAEEDAGLEAELERELDEFEKQLADFELRSMLERPAGRQQRLPAHPGRHRRHRGVRLGRRCSCACTPAGPSGTATRSRSSTSCATRRPASAAPRCTSSATTPTATSRARRACIAWCASARSTPTPGGRRRSPRWT